MLRTLLVGTLLLVPAVAQDTKTKPAKPAQETAVHLIERKLGLKFSIFWSKVRRNIVSTDTPWGFAIRSVKKGGLAARNGLKRGVIVLEIDGKPFREINELAKVLRTKKPGDVIVLDCARRKARRRLFDRKPWEDVVIKLKLEPKPKKRHKPKKPKRRFL